MVGTFGTLWARYRTLFVFWGITLALIVAAMGIQGWEAGLKSQVEAVTYVASKCPVPVTLTYPSFLFLPSSNTPEQSIVIFVADVAKSSAKIHRTWNPGFCSIVGNSRISCSTRKCKYKNVTIEIKSRRRLNQIHFNLRIAVTGDRSFTYSEHFHGKFRRYPGSP